MKTTHYFTMTAAVALLAASSALAQDVPIRVTQGEAMKAAVSKADPTYPPMAKQLRVQGIVSVQAVVDEDGSVQSVKPVTGNPLLLNAAVDALKKWKFTPFEADGKARKAILDMNFNFKM